MARTSPAPSSDPADRAVRALAEPRRREILRLVAAAELPAGAIAAAFDVNRTTISQHLTVLKEAGLLDERREGTRRLYRARPSGLAPLRAYLDEVWGASLAAAARLTEDEAGVVPADQVPAAG